MATTHTFKVAALTLAAGITVLLGVLWKYQGPATPTRTATVGPADNAFAGVQGRDVDSAQRQGPVDAAARSGVVPPPPEVPFVPPELEEPTPVQPRPDAPPAEPPPPPLVLDDAARAAEAAAFELQKQVATQVSAQLGDQRSALKQACGSAAGAFVYDLSFGADGKLLAVGLSEPRSPSAAAVGTCLRGRPLTLEVPAPGAPVNVKVALELN